MNDREIWLQAKRLEREGWNLMGRDISIHNSKETPRHLMLKSLVALKLHRLGRAWECEVEFPGKGIVDVLEWGTRGKAVVYEIETAHSPKKAREKAEQYAGGSVRDVIVIPAQDSPDSPEEIMDWLDQYVV